jgi:hypothetical protein
MNGGTLFPHTCAALTVCSGMDDFFSGGQQAIGIAGSPSNRFSFS